MLGKTRQQKGAVLLVALVVLLVMTLAGVGAMRLSITEARTAGAFSERNLMFQAAELGLDAGERFVLNSGFGTSDHTNCSVDDNPNCFNASCTNGLCFDGDYTPDNQCQVGNDFFQSPDVWNEADNYRTNQFTINGRQVTVRQIVEFRCFAPRNPEVALPDPLPAPPDVFWVAMYRVSALAEQPGGARVMLQSTYRAN